MTGNRLFVYGTLRRGSGAPMQALLERHAEWLGPATARGRLYHVGAYPGFRPAGDAASRVVGDLYRVRNPASWRRLDAHEGIGPEFPKPQEYRRERIAVMREDGRREQAWVYVYNRPVTRRRRIESGDFLA